MRTYTNHIEQDNGHLQNRDESLLCHMIHCFKEQNCGSYSSQRKKIFDISIFFASKIVLFFHVNPCKFPSITRAFLFSILLPQEFQKKNNISDKIVNLLVDQATSLGKKFLILDLSITDNVL